jgi:uncharacterized protein (DUF4415 family)
MSEERIVRYTRDNLPEDTQTDWARVKAMTEEEIDAAARSDPDAQPLDVDAPDFWKNAVLVLPSKRMVCLRIDRDILDWFRSQGKGYQTRMNAVLRAYMEAQIKAKRSDQ